MIGKNGKKTSMSETFNTDIIILFDSSSNLKQLKNFPKNVLVITFDYESHKLLSQKNIPHKISDDFISKSDLLNIHWNSMELSKWYDDPTISKLFDYNGINLGKLFYVEFHYFLVPFLKKFVEFLEINKKYPNSNFFASYSLFQIAREFISSVKIFEQDNQKQDSFLYDFIKFQLTDSVTINIHRKSYFKIKKISELIIPFFLKNMKLQNQQKSVLLVEFDPIRYEKLFKLSTNYALNLILYNRRRPTIWNRKSYSLIKNSNCTVATYQNIVNKKIEELIKNEQRSINKKLQELWNDEKFFKSFFTIYNYSFWNIIKSYFMNLCHKRILEAIQEIIVTKQLLKKIKTSCVLVWSENGFNEQIAIKLAKKNGIKVVLIQHGMYSETEIEYTTNEFLGVIPNESNKVIVWGKETQQYMTNHGFFAKTETLGSVSYDKIFDRRTKLNSEDFILLATSSPVKNEVFDLTIKTRQNYENTIKKICKIVSNHNKKLIIKLHPFQEEIDISNIAKETDSTISVIKSGDILSLIERCKIFLIIDHSTTILEAQILKKPVISILVKERISKSPPIFNSQSCVVTTVDDFEKSFNKVLNDINYRQQIIEKGNNFVNNYILNQGKAAQEILSFLENYD